MHEENSLIREEEANFFILYIFFKLFVLYMQALLRVLLLSEGGCGVRLAVHTFAWSEIYVF